MIDQDRLVRTLRDIVRIPSHESMEDISRYIAEEARKLGLDPDVDKDGNVVVSIGSGPAILLNAHLDTVGINDYSDALSGEARGGKLYGRGSTDCKAGVAAMLEIMKLLKKDPPRKQVIFAFTVWEEGGGPEKDGAYTVAEKIKATHGIVLEGSVREDSSIGVSLGCKGRVVYNIDVLGKATHSGTPHKGINPIYLASNLVEKLKDLETVKLDIPGYGQERSYFSITQIEAKEGTNVIPGRCRLTADYRMLPGEKEPKIRKRVEDICKGVLGDSYKISFRDPKEGSVQTDPDFVKLCSEAVDETGFKHLKTFSFGWNDSAVFNEAGIITLKIGPGTVGQDHANPEYCWIPGLTKGTHAILNAVRSWDAI